MTGLDAFQAEVPRLFFSQPATDGFVLAGGGALIASGLSTRPTEDRDFLGERGHADVAAREQLEAVAVGRGCKIDRLHMTESCAPPTFGWHSIDEAGPK